jgi:hypothetical protein
VEEFGASAEWLPPLVLQSSIEDVFEGETSTERLFQEEDDGEKKEWACEGPLKASRHIWWALLVIC